MERSSPHPRLNASLKSQRFISRESQNAPYFVTWTMQTDDLQSLLSVPSTIIRNIYVMVYPINSNSYLLTSTHDIIPCTKPYATFVPSSLSTRHSSVYLTANNTRTSFPHHTARSPLSKYQEEIPLKRGYKDGKVAHNLIPSNAHTSYFNTRHHSLYQDGTHVKKWYKDGKFSHD